MWRVVFIMNEKLQKIKLRILLIRFLGKNSMSSAKGIVATICKEMYKKLFHERALETVISDELYSMANVDIIRSHDIFSSRKEQHYSIHSEHSDRRYLLISSGIPDIGEFVLSQRDILEHDIDFLMKMLEFKYGQP